MPGNGRSSARSTKSGADADVRRRGIRSAAPVAATTPTRAERRKHETGERLLDAALQVFLERGYDGATTTAIARAADLGAGTFYLHFRDKRAAFEGIAQRVARSVLERWTAALRPELSPAECAGLALELTADFWREHPDQTRLLLEGGPSFGTTAHVRLVDTFAATLQNRFDETPTLATGRTDTRALGALVVGLAIEIGRLVLANHGQGDQATIERMISMARHAASSI